MTYYEFSALFNALVSVSLGVFVLQNNYKIKVNKNLIFLCFSTTFWSVFYFLWQIETSEQKALLWTRLLMFGAILVPVAYFKVVTAFLNIEKKQIKITISNNILVTLFSLLLLTPLMVAKVEPVAGFIFWPKPGFVYHFFLAWFLGISMYSAYLAFRALKEEKFSNLKKIQIKYILFGIAISILGGSTNYFLWYDIPIKPYGNILASTYVMVSVYAIIRHRFLGINLIANKIYAYFLTSIFLLFIFYFGVAFLMKNELQTVMFTPSVLLLFFCISLIFSIIFLFFLKKIEESGDRLFFKGYDPRKIIKDLMIKISSTIDVKEILEISKKEFQKVLKTKNINIAIFDLQADGKTKCLVITDKLKKTDTLSKLEYSVCVKLIEGKELIIRDEIYDDNDLVEKLDKQKIKIIVPFFSNDKLIGAIILREKNNKEAYTVEDIEFLERIRFQIAIAIENALLHKTAKEQKDELAKFNQRLGKMVKEQTKEIFHQNKDLQKLLKAKSKFLDIVSHQLRTPVGVIKGTLDMIQKDNVKNKEKLMEGVYVKSMKISEVIDEIIYAFDVEANKISIKLKAVDIVELLQKSINNHSLIAKEAGIKFDLKIPKEKLLPVLADPKHLEKSISILANNSVIYNKVNGKVVVKLEQNIDKTIITVSDTGAGISKDYIKSLFRAFTRGSNANEFDVNRSGLGLYIAKKIINAHKDANIRLVETKLGHGSVFEISIPTLTKKRLVG